MSVAPSHPVQTLLFSLLPPIIPDAELRMSRFVEDLADLRTWILGPPQYVNEVSDPGDAVRDSAIRTIGGVMLLYSAHPPHDHRLPWEVDSTQLQEVKALLQAVSAYTAATSSSVVFELDGVEVGEITNGTLDESLSLGLLDEWERELQRRKPSV